MIFIVSLIVTFLILLISALFYYIYLKPKKQEVTPSKVPVAKTITEQTASQSKKSKKQKKSHKIASTETNENKTTQDEVVESVNVIQQTDESLSPETEIVPLISVQQESAISNDTLDENSSEIENLKTEIKKSESEKLTLNHELEEAQEKIAKYREDTETLNEENKTIKSKLTKLERSKVKFEEQFKKLEATLSESLIKNEEIDRKLSQNHLELTQKLEESSLKLNKTESDLKLEKEKLHLIQQERDDAIKNREEINRKYKELFDKNKLDNSNHVNMYRQYESKIEQINSDYKQMKVETVNLNNLLQAKEKEVVNANRELENLNIQLTKSKEEISSISLTLAKVSKEFNEKLSHTSHVSNENRRLSEVIDNLQTEISLTKKDNDVKFQKMSEDLNNKDSMLHGLERDKNLIEIEIDGLKKELINFKSKTVEIEDLKKVNQELLNKLEITKNEFEEQKTKLLREIERQNQDYIVKVGIANEESCLREEVTLLKASCSIKEEELSKLHEISEELKEKKNDLRVLQDHKMDMLKEINELKNEINLKDFAANEKIIELTQKLKDNEIVITTLLNEKNRLETKLEDLKKSTSEKEIHFQNSKSKVEFDELSKQLEQKKAEVLRKERENCELKSQLTNANENHKRQIDDLNENLKKKINELNMEWKNKYEQLDKELRESIDLSRQQLENIAPVESFIQKSYSKPIESFASSSRTTEEMESHIVKLESELLALQRKYYDLKNTAIASDDIPVSHSKCAANVNIFQSDIISIPPTTLSIETETVSDIKIDQSHNASHLLDSIEKLNFEISEQRLKNKTLGKQLIDKNIEVNVLKQCLYGLDGDLLSIEHLALDLQKSFTESSTEKNKLKADYIHLLKEHESVKAKYDSLAEEFYSLRNSSEIQDNNETIKLLEEQLIKCQEENYHLKFQLDHYRETLEKTENCLQNIQASVDQEENNWKICLKSSEQEQERLEEKIKELLIQIEELRSKQHSDSPTMISMETPPIANGSLSSETKKKRKRKNKKKKNKNRVTQQ